jgi:hypothetical protein
VAPKRVRRHMMRLGSCIGLMAIVRLHCC